MLLQITELYNVLDKKASTIEVGEYNPDTGEYFNCTVKAEDGEELARYRYFTNSDIPKHTVIGE